jgi:Family of unknown function (DUF5317)
LPWLCDILPLPRWLPRANVLSIGDVLLALGVGGWIFASMARTPDAVAEHRQVRSDARS